MKRRIFHLASPPLSPDYNPFPKKLCSGGTTSLLLIPRSKSLQVKSEIIDIINQPSHSDLMMIDEPEGLGEIYDYKDTKVLVFLDAQGKQYIEEFTQIFNDLDSRMLAFLVSYNLNETLIPNTTAYVATNSEAQALTKYFQILDPLGGGQYPLNYMIIVSDNLIRVKIPVRLNHSNPYEKFGVPLDQLHLLLNDLIANI